MCWWLDGIVGPPVVIDCNVNYHNSQCHNKQAEFMWLVEKLLPPWYNLIILFTLQTKVNSWTVCMSLVYGRVSHSKKKSWSLKIIIFDIKPILNIYYELDALIAFRRSYRLAGLVMFTKGGSKCCTLKRFRARLYYTLDRNLLLSALLLRDEVSGHNCPSSGHCWTVFYIH